MFIFADLVNQTIKQRDDPLVFFFGVGARAALSTEVSRVWLFAWLLAWSTFQVKNHRRVECAFDFLWTSNGGVDRNANPGFLSLG